MLILRYVVGDIDCFPVEPDCAASAPVAAAKSSEEAVVASLDWGEVAFLESEDGQQRTRIPLAFQGNGSDVYAAQLVVPLDPTLVDVEAVTADVPEGWHLVHNVADDGTRFSDMMGSVFSQLGSLDEDDFDDEDDDFRRYR